MVLAIVVGADTIDNFAAPEILLASRGQGSVTRLTRPKAFQGVAGTFVSAFAMRTAVGSIICLVAFATLPGVTAKTASK
jgi:hypothetical protein